MMRSLFNNVAERNNNLIFIIFTLVPLLTIIFFNIPFGARAEESEPVMNFYIERELLGHSDDVSALTWSLGGQWIASGSQDNSTNIWSTETWSILKTLDHPAPVKGISCGKNALRLAISHGNGSIEIWNSVSWTLIKTLLEHTDAVLGLSWSPDGTKFSTGDNSGNIKIWDTTTWNSIETLGIPGGVKDLQWSNLGDKLAACSSNGTISVWDTSGWTSIQTFDITAGDQSVESIAWSPDDTKLASCSEENELKVWDTLSWEAMQTLGVESNPKKVSWSSDDAYIAVSIMGGIKIWDVTEWKVINTTRLEGNSQVIALVISPNGYQIATSSPSKTDNTVIIWSKNFSPVLDPIGNLTATEDQLFIYTVSATDDDSLTYSDDSSLFDINPISGQISFVPTNDDIGEHTTTIMVNDGKGGLDNETFIFTIINVDDPPVPVLKWYYGADFVNITIRVGGQKGNFVVITIEEDGIPIDEITVERESEILDEERLYLDMNLNRTYRATIGYTGSTGQNPVAVTFERGGIAFTKHLLFDSELGAEQTEDLQMSDFFKAMGIIVFNATASTDVDNEIVRYLWNFDDGVLGEGKSTVHSFGENGNYHVNLTVESDNSVNSSITTVIPLNGIPDKEALESALGEDLTQEYLESTDQIAAFVDSRNHMNIVDSWGNIVGFTGDSYKFEIDGVYIAYSMRSGEVYYLPCDLKLTYNIVDTEEAYELKIFIPQEDHNKIISISGEGAGDALELDEEGSAFVISTAEMEKEYSLRIEAKGASGTESFTLTDVNISSGDKHHYFVNNWEDLTSDAKAVTLGIDKDSDGEIDLFIDLKNGMTGEDIQIIIMNRGKSGSEFLTTLNLLLIVGFVSIAGVGCLIGSSEVGKLALLSLILPLYTRIKKDEILDNEIRGMIRGYIIANPGDNYNSIKKVLGLNNGALAYHLKVLERAELIKSRKDGMYKRFYPAGMRIPRENGGGISEIQRILLLEIAESPGISQKEIAAVLGLSKGVVNYHVKALREKQILQIEKRGRKTYCYANPKVLHRIKKTS